MRCSSDLVTFPRNTKVLATIKVRNGIKDSRHKPADSGVQSQVSNKQKEKPHSAEMTRSRKIQKRVSLPRVCQRKTQESSVHVKGSSV